MAISRISGVNQFKAQVSPELARPARLNSASVQRSDDAAVVRKGIESGLPRPNYLNNAATVLGSHVPGLSGTGGIKSPPPIGDVKGFGSNDTGTGGIKAPPVAPALVDEPVKTDNQLGGVKSPPLAAVPE